MAGVGKRLLLGALHSPLGRIPRELVAAKNELRDRLFAPMVKASAKAWAARKERHFQPEPALNLVGVGIGEKLTAGKRTGQPCLKVLVARKFLLRAIKRPHRIPAQIAGLPTDIEAVGYPKRFTISQRRRWRPIVGGVSVGLDTSGVFYAGTLGMIVTRRSDGKLFALSNNHVLADENRIEPGAAVVQPGTLDGGKRRDRIGRLAQFVPLRFDNRPNRMDAAIAELDEAIAADRRILEIGPPAGAANPTLNLLVRKSGRTTGLTEGIIRVVNFDVVGVEYERGLVRVDDVVVIEGIGRAFSRPGDSGSAVVDPLGRVVALLFAGSPRVTFAIPIRRILNRFKIRIATA